MKCDLCKKETNGQRGLSSHLRQTHGVNTLSKFQEYYDKYILSEDITCPICKVNKRKFISFNRGYAKTCIGFLNQNGKTCRAEWANQDKEKASRIAIETIKRLKETPSETNLRKTKYQIQKDHWYETMTKTDEYGKDKFDKIGEKVQVNHLTIDSETGKTRATSYTKKSASFRTHTLLPSGKTIGEFSSKKAADTVSKIIMSDGRTKKEHMTDKANLTRQNILPNGLTIAQETARKAYETKIQNGTLPKYYGYSKISESIFKRLVEILNLDKTKCYYGSNEKQFVNLDQNTIHRFDFVYMSDDVPIIVIEFQGNQYHIRESELEVRKNDTDPHGTLLLENYNRDIIKRQFIQKIYPSCKFYYIWEDTIENDLKLIYDNLKCEAKLPSRN